MDMTAHPQVQSSAVRRARVAAAVLVGLITATLAGCGSAHSNSSTGGSAPPIVGTPSPPHSGANTPPATPPTATPPTTATPPGTGTGTADCPRNLVVPTPDRARSFCVARGGTVTIVAPADQAQGWSPFDTSGNSLAVTTARPPVSGSSKILAVFKAVASGSSVVSSAHRNCPPSGGVSCNSIVIWQVTITVK